MRICGECGGEVVRVRRRFGQRLLFSAIYMCQDCRDTSGVPRRYRYHLGDVCRCPSCGKARVTRLRTRDQIEPMAAGLLNLMERILGRGKLYHCPACRVQFFDRRKPEAREPELAASARR